MKLFEKIFGKEETNKSEKNSIFFNEENNYPLIDLEQFKNTGVLFIVGNSGAGLTLTARLIAAYLKDKDYYNSVSVFAGFSTAFEYILLSPMRHFHRSLDIDYPEVITGEKDIKYVYGDIVNKLGHILPPDIYLFDVRDFLDSELYEKLIEGFINYFTEVENQILVIDHIGNIFKKKPKLLETLKTAGEKNLIIMNTNIIEYLDDFIQENKDLVSLLFLKRSSSTKRMQIQTTNIIPKDLADEYLNLRFMEKYQEVLMITPKNVGFYKLPFVCCRKDYKKSFGGV